MKRVLVFLALAALFGGAVGEAFAKSSGTQNRTLVVSTRKQNGNNWEVWQNNRGMDVVPYVGSEGGYWPKGSGRNYLSGGGLWVGSIDTTGGFQDTLVSWAYNPNSGNSMFGPCSPNGNDSTGGTDPLARVYLSTDPFDRAVWPVRDSLGRPVYQSMQDAWAISNDVDTMYARSPDKPMGVQIIRTSYAWQFQGLADILLYSFEIKNVTKRVPRYKPNGIPLKRVIIGLCLDADIGNESGPYANDKYNLHASWYHRQVGDSVPRNLAVQYQTSQEPGWTIPPPYFVGFRFLEGPINNTGSTIQIRSNNYPQYNRDILPGRPLGMTACKVFNINTDPSRAPQRYLELAGYFYLNPVVYEPYDNDFPGPSDHRSLQSSGPFNLPVDSTVHIVVAVIGGSDSLSIIRASDRAQDIYDNWRNSVRWVQVVSPNGGEVVSGTIPIAWTSNGTANDSVDLYVTSNGGITWDTLAANRPNNGSYSWNTTRGPDGTRYLVGAFFHNAAIAAWDFSDSTFTVNNTGNGPPDVQLYAPVGRELWSGVQNILWYARSPGGRSLQVNLRYSWDGKRTWQAIASNVPNTGSYAWDTRNFPNGNQYYAAVTAWDSLHLVGDTSGSWFTVDNTHQPAGQVVHDSGGATTVEINPYVIDPPRVTGHRYRIRFLPIGKDTTSGNDSTALYSYDLWDLDLGQRVITNRVTSVIQNNSLVFDNSPVVDGLRVEMKHRVFAPFFRAGVIAPSPSYTDTVLADTLYAFAGFSGFYPMWWSARGRDFVRTWHRGGGSRGDSLLWVTVRDFTNQVDVPFEGGRNFSGLRASSWAFGVDVDSVGYQTIDSVSCSGVYNTRDKKKARWLYLCGFRYLFNYHTIFGQRRPDKMVWARRPADGDVWYIQQAGQRPPYDGDVYTFQTQVGVEEARNFGGYAFSLGQAYPNPATHQATIPFSLAKKGKATLKVYNVTGALVRNLVDEVLDAGRYQAVWDGRNDHGKQTACGVYLYRLEAPGRTAVRKMVVLR